MSKNTIILYEIKSNSNSDRQVNEILISWTVVYAILEICFNAIQINFASVDRDLLVLTLR